MTYPSSAGRRNRTKHVYTVGRYTVHIPEKDWGRTMCPSNVAWLVDSDGRTFTMARFNMARWLQENRE